MVVYDAGDNIVAQFRPLLGLPLFTAPIRDGSLEPRAWRARAYNGGLGTETLVMGPGGFVPLKLKTF